MSKPSTFTEAKNEFDVAHSTAKVAKCLVPVNGKKCDTASVRDIRGRPSEENYKWQFIYAIINSGLYARDFVGVEIQFPKGNQAIIKLDGAIFDSGDWLEHYNAY
jgi:type I restriction enzyme M protein